MMAWGTRDHAADAWSARGPPRMTRSQSSSPVKSPSPVGLSSRKIRWPDCSPPKRHAFSSRASSTLRSPTSVSTMSTFAPESARRRPRLLIDVITSPPPSMSRDAKSSAKSVMRSSPSRTAPSPSTAMRRSASPSKARPRSAPSSRTLATMSSTWVDPQFSLILRPLGVLCIIVRRAPVAAKSSWATCDAAPLAQSSTRCSDEKSPGTSSRRCAA